MNYLRREFPVVAFKASTQQKAGPVGGSKLATLKEEPMLHLQRESWRQGSASAGTRCYSLVITRGATS